MASNNYKSFEYSSQSSKHPEGGARKHSGVSASSTVHDHSCEVVLFPETEMERTVQMTGCRTIMYVKLRASEILCTIFPLVRLIDCETGEELTGTMKPFGRKLKCYRHSDAVKYGNGAQLESANSTAQTGSLWWGEWLEVAKRYVQHLDEDGLRRGLGFAKHFYGEENIKDGLGWQLLNEMDKSQPGYLQRAELMLKVGCAVRRLQGPDRTALLAAVNHRLVEAIKLLIKNRADVNGGSGKGWTPLHEACLQCDKEIVHILLQSNADPVYPDINGDTPMHICARLGSRMDINSIMRILVNASHQRQITICPINYDKESPLLEVTRLKDEGTMKLLLHLKSNPNGVDHLVEAAKFRCSTLHLAVKLHKESLLEMLLERGADTNQRTFPYNENERIRKKKSQRNTNDARFSPRSGGGHSPNGFVKPKHTMGQTTPRSKAHTDGRPTLFSLNKGRETLVTGGGTDIGRQTFNTNDGTMERRYRSTKSTRSRGRASTGSSLSLSEAEPLTPLQEACRSCGRDQLVNQPKTNFAQNDLKQMVTNQDGQEPSFMVQLIITQSKAEEDAKLNPGDFGNDDVIQLDPQALRQRWHRFLLVKLIRAQADVNIKDGAGRTPLHDAVKAADSRLSQILIKAGASVDASDRSGITVLHIAVKFSRKENVSLLLEALADVSMTDVDGWSVLHEAAFRGDQDVTQALIEVTGAGRKQVEINALDSEGSSPLHVAVTKGRKHVVELLIATTKVDVNLRDNNTRTPLLIAVKSGWFSIVQILIQATADCNIATRVGWAPLHQAIREQNYDEVDTLLKAKANVSACGTSGWTPLHELIRSKRSDVQTLAIVNKLVAGGASINLKETVQQKTAFLTAVESGNIEMVNEIINCGANVDLNVYTEDVWKTAALYTGKREMVDMIGKVASHRPKRIIRGIDKFA